MDTLDWYWASLEQNIYLSTIAAYTNVVEFVGKIDLATRIALIALFFSLALNIYTAILLYSPGVRKMGKQRKRIRNRIIADDVCEALERRRVEGKLTDKEVECAYATLARALHIPELKPRHMQVPGQESPKERLMRMQIERMYSDSYDKATGKGNGKAKLPDAGQQPKPKEKKFKLSFANGGTEPKKQRRFRILRQAT